jgi:hypothetical protein
VLQEAAEVEPNLRLWARGTPVYELILIKEHGLIMPEEALRDTEISPAEPGVALGSQPARRCNSSLWIAGRTSPASSVMGKGLSSASLENPLPLKEGEL